MLIIALITAPVLTSMPNRISKPNPAPATLPILNAKPPKTISSAQNIAAAENGFVRHVLSAFAADGQNAPDIKLRENVQHDRQQNNKSETRQQLFGKNVVCVKNPGPIAEVAIRKAAPTMTDETEDFFILKRLESRYFFLLIGCLFRVQRKGRARRRRECKSCRLGS